MNAPNFTANYYLFSLPNSDKALKILTDMGLNPLKSESDGEPFLSFEEDGRQFRISEIWNALEPLLGEHFFFMLVEQNRNIHVRSYPAEATDVLNRDVLSESEKSQWDDVFHILAAHLEALARQQG